MNIENEIREKQNQLIVMINTMFDEIVRDVGNLKIKEEKSSIEYESLYPITNTTGFKGKKPIAVKIKEKRIITPTWKKVVEEILIEILKDSNMKEKVLALRDRLLGRKRKRLSADKSEMRSPIKLDDDLYIETHYDAETLMNLLLEILDEIAYNYNNINIVIKN